MNSPHVTQRKWSIRKRLSNSIFEHDQYLIIARIVGKPSVIVLTTTDMITAEWIVKMHHDCLAACGNHIGERMSATIDALNGEKK